MRIPAAGRFGLFCLFLCFQPAVAGAYWEWTPQTRRWINPKYEVKETAEAQYEWAETFVSARDYATAIQKLRKLIEIYPASDWAPRAQYRIGEIYERDGGLDKAFEAYQKVVDNYPGSDRTTAAISRQFAIGRIMTRQRPGRLTFWKRDPSELLGSAVAAAPYAAEAEQALFELGDYLFRRRRFQESVAHFDRLLGEYPESVLAPAAEFRAALATYRQAEKQKNNDGLLLDAYGRFTACLDKYPDLRERPEAERYHRDIQSRLAEKILEAGRYYERNGNRKAAAIYYRRVGAEYPGTPAAVQASEWLKKMEG